MRKLLLAFACCIFGVGCIVAPVHAVVIIAFGDSITYGTGSFSGGYPPKLQALIAGSAVVNYGVPGESTAWGAGRIDSVLAAQADANYILILEGTNDLFYGVSIGATQYHLETMIAKSRDAGVTPVLATLTPDWTEDAGAKNIPWTYNPMIQGIGANLGVAVVDMYSALEPNWGGWSADLIHPNDTGYQIMAQNWANVIASDGGGGSGGSSGGGGCFIATAAFGSSIQPHVALLQQFRDSVLLTNAFGKKFVSLYYTYSPPIADFIAESDILRGVVRVMLYPLIGLSYVVLKASLLERILVLLVGLTLGCIAVILMRRSVSNHGLSDLV